MLNLWWSTGAHGCRCKKATVPAGWLVLGSARGASSVQESCCKNFLWHTLRFQMNIPVNHKRNQRPFQNQCKHKFLGVGVWVTADAWLNESELQSFPVAGVYDLMISSAAICGQHHVTMDHVESLSRLVKPGA